MKDGKALQSATSHYFGNNFSSVFDIKFKNLKNEYEFAYKTSWGLSARVIAAIIMTHADNDGLVFPPDIAPIQIVIIPISIKTPGVKDEANKIYKELKENFRVKIDMSDQTPGWKFAEYEMKGVPVRLEIGPREIGKNSCILVRRDTREKQVVQTANIKEEIEKLLDNIKKDLYSAALLRRDSKIFSAANINEFSKISKTKEGFIKTTWCNDLNCEEKIKNDFGLSSRCMPFDENIPDGAICPICGKIASKIIFWGRSY
jgi:prolyl-tRNA synthetase